MRRRRIDIFSALDSFRRDLERPSEHERDRKTDDDQEDEQTNDPVRNAENRQYLRESLSESPPSHEVRDRNFVNVAPLQLGEKVPRIHGE